MSANLKDIRQKNIHNHLKKLLQKTVVNLVVDNHSDSGIWGLKFNDGTIAWILCDPEGNGPGHLDITKSKL